MTNADGSEAVDLPAWDLLLATHAPRVGRWQAAWRSFLWCLAIGACCGAGGATVCALIWMRDEGESLLPWAPIFGVSLGLYIATLPSIAAAVVLTLAARPADGPATYRRWLNVTIIGLRLLVPVVGVSMYRSLQIPYDELNWGLAGGFVAAFAIAEVMLTWMDRSLRRIVPRVKPT